MQRFEDVDEVETFDGIWCCARLLHVPLAAMPATLDRLWRALRPGGTLYVSFKHGTGERVHGGRRFTDADEATLRRWFGHPKSVALSDAWIEAYEQRRLPPSRSVAPGSHGQEAPPAPAQIQHEALAALPASREGGYRRLLGHVAPSFLLGLTATADRTDPSDMLSLRDDNLVYRCHLFAGIQAAG